MVEKLIASQHRVAIASKVKGAFLANISHEIRTPLAGILGMIDVIARGTLSVEQQDSMKLLHESAERLHKLLDNTLNFSRVTRDELQVINSPFNINNVIEPIVVAARAKAAKKCLEFCWNIDSSIPKEIIGDGYLLAQALTPLLDNAVKYTEKGKVLLLVNQESASNDKISLKFSVSDTGIGISSDHQKNLYSAFTQVDSSSSRRFEGAGLGLSLTYNLVQLLGGKLNVVSAINSGSTFSFTLDFGWSKAPVVEEVTKTTEQDLNIPHLRILVAEDNTVNQTLIRRMLEKEGHDVVIATNGLEALKKLDSCGQFSDVLPEKSFDIILMDIQMPEMGGVEATSIIRNKEKGTGRRIPIVAVTAHALAGHKKEYIDAGMDGYVAKPFKVIQLKEAIAKSLARH